VESRYPGDIAELSKEEAKSARHLVHLTRQLILKKLVDV